jgi:hypothetical protein
MTLVHGFEVTPIEPTGTDPGEPSVSINLNDEIVVLPQEEANAIAHNTQNADEYRAAVLAAKAEHKTKWEKERGPDSRLGRAIEAGTPINTRGEDAPSSPV